MKTKAIIEQKVNGLSYWNVRSNILYVILDILSNFSYESLVNVFCFYKMLLLKW